MSDYRCIICSRPIGSGGYVGTKNGMSVVFCRQHSESCSKNCDSCTQSSICPVCGKL